MKGGGGGGGGSSKEGKKCVFKELRRKKRNILKLQIDGIIRIQLLPGEGYNPTYVRRKVVILIQVFQNLFG